MCSREKFFIYLYESRWLVVNIVNQDDASRSPPRRERLHVFYYFDSVVVTFAVSGSLTDASLYKTQCGVRKGDSVYSILFPLMYFCELYLHSLLIKNQSRIYEHKSENR